VELGVDEILDLLDLQGPIIVGNDGCDHNRFEGWIGPRSGRRLGGELQGRYHFQYVWPRSQRSGYRHEQ
jgi:hypothetical protein